MSWFVLLTGILPLLSRVTTENSKAHKKYSFFAQRE
jgi:hypothetical protein